MTATPVVVIGQIARDLAVRVERIPDPGGTVDVAQRRELLGGKGANIAVGLVQLGVAVSLLGVVGDDSVGTQLIEQCTRDGIEADPVIRRAGAESALMIDIVTADGRWRYLESVPSGTLLTKADVEAEAPLMASTETLVIQLQQPVAAALTAIDLAGPRRRIILDGARVRFGLFHLLQASARAEQRPIAAKGLTGTGYSGHAFWETEMYVLPVLTTLTPTVVADALTWRHATLPLARERAGILHLRGAALPWRTISGRECGAYWPAGTAAFHVNAAVAAAVGRYVAWTGDHDFERERGIELLVETARLWESLGYYGDDGRFHLDGVTGPDEYSALVDDNTYTNVMAAQNLRDAARTARRWPDAAERCAVAGAEILGWLRAAAAMTVPFDDGLDLPQQYRGSTERQCWDFDATAGAGLYPLQEHYPYVDIYRKQVAKQADLMLAMHWAGDRFTADIKDRSFVYTEAITVRDSSLSASTQAVLAAELGHLDLAHAYVREATLMDLDDLHHDTDDGLHMASLAGGWIGLVCGFGGLRDHDDRLSFAPRLPSGITRLAFSVRWRGRAVDVIVTDTEVLYAVRSPADVTGAVDREEDDTVGVELLHHGQPLIVLPGVSRQMPIPSQTAPTQNPRQPTGRAPDGT